MAGRLKVFVTSDGFTEHVVAATSRPKALAAWGAHQDLFKTGGARETSDPELVKAALAHPGEVLRRSSGMPEMPKVAKRPPKPKQPSKADLERVARAEAKLANIRAAHETAQARIEAAKARLEAEARAEKTRFEAMEPAAEQALAEAQAKLETYSKMRSDGTV